MAKRGQLVPEEKMATFFDLVVLDATTVQLHLALDKARTSNDPDLKSYIESTSEVSNKGHSNVLNPEWGQNS